MDEKDYINIFEQSSELLVVIDPQFTIVAVSDSFVKTTSTVGENIVGCNNFDVFPDNPDDEKANEKSKVLKSFNRMLTNKTPDSLPVIKFDIPKPASAGGRFEMKYWQTTNSPILDANNKVKYIIQWADDVTENKLLIAQLAFEKNAKGSDNAIQDKKIQKGEWILGTGYLNCLKNIPIKWVNIKHLSK